MKKMYKRLSQNKKMLISIIVVLVVILAAVLFALLYNKKDYKEIDVNEAVTKTENFVNTYLMPSGSQATIIDTSEEYGLYKMNINIGSESPVESYVTKDGKLFFPQAINIDQEVPTPATGAGTSAPAATVSVKNDKPVVELFIMSYCPYGTQIEKGILPVIETLGNKIDYTLKFVDYAMHDKKELDENLLQYCIQKEQPEKLNDYLTCFLAEGDSAGCLNTTGVNKDKTNSCVSATDKEFKITANYNSKTDWQGSYPSFNVDKADNDKYGVGGSPTLVINGAQISSGRDSASLLATICSAFNTPPAECNTQLNSQSPTPGFGFDYSANSNSAAACN
ncbi:MAG: hypothetical protein PHE20_03610 [Patescibacteria group bacterium]|nr:hypothetical protein [Patescibacteria group bacterium]